MEERIVFDRKYESEHPKKVVPLAMTFSLEYNRITISRQLVDKLGITAQVPYVKLMWLGELYIAHSDDMEYGYKVHIGKGSGNSKAHHITCTVVIRKFFELIGYKERSGTFLIVKPTTNIDIDGKLAYQVTRTAFNNKRKK